SRRPRATRPPRGRRARATPWTRRRGRAACGCRSRDWTGGDPPRGSRRPPPRGVPSPPPGRRSHSPVPRSVRRAPGRRRAGSRAPRPVSPGGRQGRCRGRTTGARRHPRDEAPGRDRRSFRVRPRPAADGTGWCRRGARPTRGRPRPHRPGASPPVVLRGVLPVLAVGVFVTGRTGPLGRPPDLLVLLPRPGQQLLHVSGRFWDGVVDKGELGGELDPGLLAHH